MELLTALAERRAVRDYQPTPIEGKVVEQLINAAILAPSARNLQPWAFAVLLNSERIEQYAQRAKAWLLEYQQELGLGNLIDMLQAPNFSIFYGAPALILVLATDTTNQAAEDCCLAAQNLMLAARDRNLGTCWIGMSRRWLNLTSTKTELGLPERYPVVAPIILGHPKSWPTSHGRHPADIHWMV
jgi:nitroreductase